MNVVPFPRRQARPLLPELPLDTLTEPEQFLVWALRIWAGAVRRGEPLGVEAADGFRLAGAVPAMAPLNALMTGLVAHRAAPLDIRCLACPGLGEAEAPILQAIAYMQSGALQNGARALGPLVTADAPLGWLVFSGRCLAGALAVAGLDLPLRAASVPAGTTGVPTVQDGGRIVTLH